MEEQFETQMKRDKTEEMLNGKNMNVKIAKSTALDIEFVCESFLRSIENKNEIVLYLYIEAYIELIK